MSAAAAGRWSPLVSIVVPVFNGERYLRESLDSILGQTYPHTEVVVMDDASTDATPEVVGSYTDARLRCVRQPVNRGQFGNVNDGIRLTHGELVAVHHADDVYAATLLERQLDVLARHPDVGAVFAIDTFIDAEGREVGRLRLPPELRDQRPLSYTDVLNGFLRYGNSFVRAPTNLVRRRVYDEVGLFDEAYDLRADLDMWLRVVRHSPIVVLDQHLVAYRFGHDNVSARYERLRTTPELSFSILDRRLADGDAALAEPDALVSYEGRRHEDLVLVAVNAYVRGDLAACRARLAQVRWRRILAARRLQRLRLLVLLAGLQVLARLPRIPPLARLFHRRWHVRGVR